MLQYLCLACGSVWTLSCTSPSICLYSVGKINTHRNNQQWRYQPFKVITKLRTMKKNYTPCGSCIIWISWNMNYFTQIYHLICFTHVSNNVKALQRQVVTSLELQIILNVLYIDLVWHPKLNNFTVLVIHTNFLSIQWTVRNIECLSHFGN